MQTNCVITWIKAGIPGGAADGVSVTVPVALLNRVPKYRFDWLVPGLLREKCIQLVKGLPELINEFVEEIAGMGNIAKLSMSDMVRLQRDLGHQLADARVEDPVGIRQQGDADHRCAQSPIRRTSLPWTWPCSSRRSPRWTGATMVRSGRCEPPKAGWLVTTTSPQRSSRWATSSRTHSPMAPR